MMGSEFNPYKRRYDLSMSKRTRKPSKHEGTSQLKSTGSSTGRLGNTDHKSLRELINGGSGEEKMAIDKKQNVKLIENEGEGKCAPENGGRNSLRYYLKEQEEDLQLVSTKQQGEGMKGVKLGGMVSRYVKVLNHLIKVQRDPCLGSRKKPVLRLTM
ncbi:hypothetical protein BVC80_8883g27 [Macleaya cordata]|uniref:Uncharacterized protein n=1 Tax=Macleaya cordata TaxID=56857 RepID=A0A200Q7F3_MACCD|nr:hypothetical protein BVC80_8883g27 [Macleaya cordata]